MSFGSRQSSGPALEGETAQAAARSPGAAARFLPGSFSIRRQQGPWKDALLRRLLATADASAVLVGSAGAAIVSTPTIAVALWLATLLPLWIVTAKMHGLYDNDRVRIRHLTTDELPGLFRWVTVSAVLATLTLSFAPASPSPAGAVMLFLVTFVSAFVFRSTARAAFRRLVPPERGIVVGHGQLADAFRRKLRLEPGHHLAVVGSLEPRSDGSGSVDGPRLPGLDRTIEREGVERVVIAMHDLDEQTLARVIASCNSLGVKLSVAPPLRAMLGTAVRLNHLAELPLIEFKTWDPSRSTMLMKRALDIGVAVAGLALLAPALVAIGLLVRIDSPGPALFRQRRAGLQGKPFELLKFRTMVRDAEARLHELVTLEELPEPMYKLREDPRVTRVGRVLRRTSLDELPQLINVVRGQMSLVGPRPEEERLAQRYGEELRFRFQMRPGITGPMQVHGRGELTFQERIAVEREYVENYSVRRDVKLLLQTAAAVARGRGAF